MNNKGFTLIELIATIALLAIIATISFVAISGVVQSSKKRDCETLVGNIESAVRDYASDNRYDKGFINGVVDYKTSVNIHALLNENYLKVPIKNPYTKEDYSDSELNNINISILFNKDYTVKDTEVSGIVCE